MTAAQRDNLPANSMFDQTRSVMQPPMRLQLPSLAWAGGFEDSGYMYY